jgi:toxin YxiD
MANWDNYKKWLKAKCSSITINKLGGENEWWKMHPSRYPNEHQRGIHGSGSPASELFK